MKRIKTLASRFPVVTGLLLGAILGGALLRAQEGTPPGSNPVTQTAARADAAIREDTSASSAATITIPAPGPGKYIYIWGVNMQNCAGASAVTAAAVTTMTTTNLTGSPAYTFGSGTTAGACQPAQSIIYQTGLKATSPGVAVTYVLPTFATNQTIRVSVASSIGP